MTLRIRAERVEGLIERYRALDVPLAQLHRQTKAADPEGKGVSYVHMRRILEGAIPTHRILDKIEAGILLEERERVGTGNAAAA